MTGLQQVVTAGGLIGAGLALLLWRLTPAHPDLAETLARLSPAGARAAQEQRAQARTSPGDPRQVLGSWGQRHLPVRLWGAVPAADLAILRMSPTRFCGEKLLFALVGMVTGPLLSTMAVLAGFGLPVYVPVVASLALAAALFHVPTYNVTVDSATARLEFSRALGAFTDLMALERAAGSGPRQAMEAAAAVGDSWVFARLAEELARTRWSGVPAWDALRQLGEELAVPELHELADIMRLSGEEGAQVYAQLRARSTSMRSALLNAQKTEANKTSGRMSVPVTFMGLTFLALLMTPQMLRFLGG